MSKGQRTATTANIKLKTDTFRTEIKQLVTAMLTYIQNLMGGGVQKKEYRARLGRRGGAANAIPSHAILEALKLIFISIEFSGM